MSVERPQAPGRAIRVMPFPSRRFMVGNGPLPSPDAEPSLMGMPQPADRWTADLVRSLPDDGQRYELIGGTLVVTPAPVPRHQQVVAALHLLLHEWLRDHARLQVLFSPADIALGEDEILQPDLFVYHGESGAPLMTWRDINRLELVIEVASPSTAHYDRQLKRRRYQRGRVPEYWIVDAETRQVERWRPGDETPEVLREGLNWQPEEGGPTHELDLGKFFRELMGESEDG